MPPRTISGGDTCHSARKWCSGGQWKLSRQARPQVRGHTPSTERPGCRGQKPDSTAQTLQVRQSNTTRHLWRHPGPRHAAKGERSQRGGLGQGGRLGCVLLSHFRKTEVWVSEDRRDTHNRRLRPSIHFSFYKAPSRLGKYSSSVYKLH